MRDFRTGGSIFKLCFKPILPSDIRKALHRYFYKSGKLIKNGILTLDSRNSLAMDLSDHGMHLDRRMMEFLVGT